MTLPRKLRHLATGIWLGWLVANPAAGANAGLAYNDVLGALQSARTVKVVVDLHQCKLKGGNKPGPAVLGGLVINALNVVPHKGILFSDVHHTLDSSGKPVTAYIRYDLTQNNELTLTVTRLSEGSPRKEDIFLCPVPGGAKFIW
jgi:VirK protein